MIEKKDSKACALILGGYINGYSIARELKEEGVKNVWLFDYGKSIARASNQITGVTAIQKNKESLKEAIFNLKDRFDYLICYPTDDMQLELLLEIHDEIENFCFLPFNHENLTQSLDKNIQYHFCEKLGVPYPKTIELKTEMDLANIENLLFPLIIKPNTRRDIVENVFRSMYVSSSEELLKNKEVLQNYLDKGFTFLVSEFVPGDDTQIYAYTGYRSKNGSILNEWTGKKLSQFPDNFGVFSSASNEAPDVVLQQGRELLNGMNLYGIAEPEFKYDSRDGQYKLMEINLRSMMWHRVGNLSGVKLHLTQWNDALNLPIIKYNQNKNEVIHYVYMKHELLNLLSRLGYLKLFIHNVFFGQRKHFAVLNGKDIKPFVIDLLSYPRNLGSVWIKVLKKLFS
ncbi:MULTISPECIES: hypothetical protein [Acinetobacter]|uniref:carboxylate--amine ligase n=1 Tax=Acinetobacter TaxID=469 RepID=UPI002004E95C|nr:hypothetical protein [Acinetobacter radioresistens]MCK4078402.1 hypothetical protein [Acinetobacter radioresistens]MCK4084565.1 hypothetical protein [Acinetobacter radioresistens]